MPNHQRNSRVLVEGLGRRFFEEDWKLLRPRYPELTDDQGRSLYHRWTHAVTIGVSVNWDSWIAENIMGPPVRTPVDPASLERLGAFYRL